MKWLMWIALLGAVAEGMKNVGIVFTKKPDRKPRSPTHRGGSY